MDKNNIGIKIAELRKSKNLSQADLASKLCVSNKTISKWECGNGMPDIEMLYKISDIFGVTLDEMVNQTEKTTKKEEVKNDNQLSNLKAESKKSLTIIISFATIILIFCISGLCYFFIPRKPYIESSNLLEINQESSTLYCDVDNSKSVLSLNNQFKVPLTNKWKVYYDINGTKEISSKIVNLQIGDNTFYIIVENSTNTKKIYTLTIRRKPMYIVSFDTNGGDPIIDQLIMEGELADLVTPKREGYIFSSWNYDFTKPITQNTTIKASWIAKNFNINYHANDNSNNSLYQYVTYDTEVTIKDSNAFTKKGYTLSSWNTEADGTGISYETNKKFINYNISSDLNLYAQWTINQYEIHCSKNIEEGGTIVGTGRFDYDTQHTLSVNTNAGYTWLGWFGDDNTLISTSTILTITLSDSNYKCIAKWSPNNYLCRLNINGGNALPEENKTITFGQLFTLPIPTRTEASFEGWYYNEIQYTNKDGLSIKNWDILNTATLYAKWNVNKYLISLTCNTANGGTITGEGLKEYGSLVTIKANTNLGYTFAGWYEGNKLITNSESYTFIMSNYELSYIAKWEANSYTITLNENGGEKLSPNSKEVIFDNSYKLPTTTKVGYDFDGWYLGENGSDEKISDRYGNSLSVWNIAKNTVIYAKWVVKIYTISYALNDGVLVGVNPTTYTIEDLDIKINNPTRPGYNFIGWVGTDVYDKETNLVIRAGSIGNRMYGAAWEENDSFVAISNVNDFLNINDNLSGNYYLTNNIDLAGIQFDGFGNKDNYFSGIFDGKGFKILNLQSNSTVQDSQHKTYYGLFRYSNGVIKNIGLENYIFTKRYSCVGAIVGYNLGVIKNCYSNGEIADSIMSGGIVSYNEGIILNCYSKGFLKASNASMYTINVYSGGIVAKNNNGTIKNCFSSALVSAKEESQTSGAIMVGGICASDISESSGCIMNVFFTGSLEATRTSGHGLSVVVGKILNWVLSSVDLKNCYYQKDISITTSTGYLGDYYLDETGTEVNIDKLLKSNVVGFSEYIDSNYICINADAVWILTEMDYPKLYWENNV